MLYFLGLGKDRKYVGCDKPLLLMFQNNNCLLSISLINLHTNLEGVDYLFGITISQITHFTDGKNEAWKKQ